MNNDDLFEKKLMFQELMMQETIMNPDDLVKAFTKIEKIMDMKVVSYGVYQTEGGFGWLISFDRPISGIELMAAKMRHMKKH